jgi:hypothetical protein
VPLRVSFAGERPGPFATIRIEPARAVPAIGSFLNVAHHTHPHSMRQLRGRKKRATGAAEVLEDLFQR